MCYTVVNIALIFLIFFRLSQALDSARVVYQVLSAMPQSSSFANNMAAGSGLGPKAGTVKTPYGQLDDAGIEIAPLPLV